MSKYEELIERVENLTGPDREVDAEIREHVVGLKQYESIHERGGDLCLRYYADPTGPSYYRMPRYTESLDAALTLARNQNELLIMLYAAFDATPYSETAPDTFPAIRAALLCALRAREKK